MFYQLVEDFSIPRPFKEVKAAEFEEALERFEELGSCKDGYSQARRVMYARDMAAIIQSALYQSNDPHKKECAEILTFYFGKINFQFYFKGEPVYRAKPVVEES